MNICFSRTELNKISEALLKNYYEVNSIRIKEYVDIEAFITDFLKLKIEYVPFAEPDTDKIGFLSDGETPLSVYKNKIITSAVFPAGTIVVDKYLLQKNETGRRRFTLAHEAAHYILQNAQASEYSSAYHMEFDGERNYSKEELIRLFDAAETQADILAAALLMPKNLIKQSLKKYGLSCPVKIYDNTLFSIADKLLIHKAAESLKVSFSAFTIRLRELKMLENHSMSEFIKNELKLGGD